MATTGARTPEELDTLLEDAFVLRDCAAVGGLFGDGAVLAAPGGREARGAPEIAGALAELWARERTYVARARRVLRAGDTALVVAEAGVHVLRRDGEGTWRSAISLLEVDPSTELEAPMSEETQLLAPVATRSDEGEARWWLGALAVIKVTAEQTGGLLSIIEVTEAPNEAAPLHVHHREDEGFWVLEGDVTFEVGDTTIAASAGDFAFGPRGVPHRYTVGEAGCRMLFIMTPGGFEGLVRDMSVPARERTLPPASDEEPDWEHVAAVARAYDCELLA